MISPLQMETLGRGDSQGTGNHMQVCLEVPQSLCRPLLTWMLYCCLLCL